MSSTTSIFIVTSDKSPWKVIRAVEAHINQLIRKDMATRSTPDNILNAINDREVSLLANSTITQNGCAYTDFKYQGKQRKLQIAFFCDYDIKNIDKLDQKGKVILGMGADEMGRTIVKSLIEPLSKLGDVWHRKNDSNNESYTISAKFSPYDDIEFVKPEKKSLFVSQIKLMPDDKLYLIAESPGFFNESFTVFVIEDGMPLSSIIKHRQALVAAWLDKRAIEPLSDAEVADVVALNEADNPSSSMS